MFFKGMMFILLLTSSPSVQNNGINAMTITVLDSTTTNQSTLVKEYNSTTLVTFPSWTDLGGNATRTTVTEINNQSSKTFPTSPVNTLLSQTSHQVNQATKTVNRSSTNINNISLSSGLPTASSTMPTILENYTTTTYISSFETISHDFNTVTKNITLTTMGLPNNTEKNNTTANFTNNSQTGPTLSLTTITNNVTTDLQTRSQHSIFTEAREHQKESHSNGSVVFGAIVGAVLGTALIGLVGYFICGKRKSDSFAHQRLYDNVKNDPVLRLDSTPEPYGVNFGDFSYYNSTVINEALPQNNKETPYDAIAMDDMTSSRST